MRHFDHDYADDLVRRLRRIDPDRKPAWGRLTLPGMIQHLADALRYSLGRGGALPDESTWFARNVIAPLLLNGMGRMPRNRKGPDYPLRGSGDDLESLHALLDEYLSLVQAGELNPPPNPFFGDLGVDGWAKLHGVHFEHHLRQFGG